MNGKKLAQKLRTEDNLLIEKVGESDYWVSNTYFAVKLNNYTFEDFKDKYNSYKTTESIRKELKEGKTLSYRNGIFSMEENTPISNLLAGIQNLKPLTLTNLFISNGEPLSRIYKVNGSIGYFSIDHNWLLDKVSYENIFSEDELSSIVFKNASKEINLLIMPMRSEEDIVMKEIKKLKVEVEPEKLDNKEIKEDNSKKVKEEVNAGLTRGMETLKHKKYFKQKEKKEVKPKRENKESKKIVYKRGNKYYLYGVELSRTIVKYCKNNKNEFKIVSEYDNDNNKDNSKKTSVCTEDNFPIFAILSENELKKLKGVNFKKERIDYLNRLYVVKFIDKEDFEKAKKLAG